MNKITFPLKQLMSGSSVADLQDALNMLLKRKALLASNETSRRKLSEKLFRERQDQTYGPVTKKLVAIFQKEQQLEESGKVNKTTATGLNKLLKRLGLLDDTQTDQRRYEVRGTIRTEDGQGLEKITVQVVDRDLRHEQELGKTRTDRDGVYSIKYSVRQFRKAEKHRADLVIKAFDADKTLLAASPIVFNAPQKAEIDLVIPAEKQQPLSLFEQLAQSLSPLLDGIRIQDLEEDETHQDLSFLSGETGYSFSKLARFALSHRLVAPSLDAPFWFALLEGSFFQYDDSKSLQAQSTRLTKTLVSIDAHTLRKSLSRAFHQNEIPRTFQKKTKKWIKAFLALAARLQAKGKTRNRLVKSMLDEAGITDERQKLAFAKVFNAHKSFSREMLTALAKKTELKQEKIADLTTSFTLSNLTRADFSLVKHLKADFNIRHPKQIPKLARYDQKEWGAWIKRKHDAEEITLPVEPATVAKKIQLPITEIYGKKLESQFRQAYPTSAFAGKLEKALQNSQVHGLRKGDDVSRFLTHHSSFELLNTPVDTFLKDKLQPECRDLKNDSSFIQEMKAVQRVFKLTSTFEAVDTLLADNIHSAQQMYRLGESEFVRRYKDKPGFGDDGASKAWKKAADTHAATITVIGDLQALGKGKVPGLPDTVEQLLSTFPNWNSLFSTGGLCDCEHCRSVLGPAAYLADLLLYLKDRKCSPEDSRATRDILFERRPDLGWLELNCANSNTTLPYIDVVCEVLEAAVDHSRENDLVLSGFNTIPLDPEAGKTAVADALHAAAEDPANTYREYHQLGQDLILSQVVSDDPSQWVVHGSNVSYLLHKRGTPTSDFYARLLPNTKADASQLRAFPQYANPVVYTTLNEATSPFGLPFDLFGEEVREAFRKNGIQRWDVMQTLLATDLSEIPSDSDIAAEYFSISVNDSSPVDEKRLIFQSDTSEAAQQSFWGETGSDWLDRLGNVKVFLGKTGLEYDELLSLLDLQFINADGTLTITHLDSSCDTDQKVIESLDSPRLDRIHRFLRLWRKLDDWATWELDHVLCHPAIGAENLDETFLLNLFYFCRLQSRLGSRVSVEQLCALFGTLNTRTRLSTSGQLREQALYQTLFLNPLMFNPPSPAFVLDPDSGTLPVGETLSNHLSVLLAVLNCSESDFILLLGLIKASDSTPYIEDELTLETVSFLYRHVWLAKLLKIKVAEWATLLHLRQEDLFAFPTPRDAWEFFKEIDLLQSSGCEIDELNWLLMANRSTKAAVKEADATLVLASLRRELQAIRETYNPNIYDFLTATPPTDIESLTTLLTSLLQKLDKTEDEIRAFIATMTNEIRLQTEVTGMPAGYDFPDAIKDSIAVSYDEPTTTLRFTGMMTDSERTTLLSDPTLSEITSIATYQEAVAELFSRPRLSIKFYTSVFTTPLEVLPAAIDFQAQLPPGLALKINYDAEQRLLCFAGVMTREELSELEALSADADYRSALATLMGQPEAIVPPDERIWLLDSDLTFPLHNPETGEGHLAENLALAITRALDYLTRTLSETILVQQIATQLGLTEESTHLLLTRFSVLPESLLEHMMGVFATSLGVISSETMEATFNAWFWLCRAATLVNRWDLSFFELQQVCSLADEGHCLNLHDLPLHDDATAAPLRLFLQTSHLLNQRNYLSENTTTLLSVLVQLADGTYDALSAVDPAHSAQQLFSIDLHNLNETWQVSDAESLVASWNLSFPEDYLFPTTWERLSTAFSYLDKINAGADTAKVFACPAMGWQEAKSLRELFRSRFGQETWLSLYTEIQDKLRERKRNALTAYLLSQPPPESAPTQKWDNSNDLYAYYLLDVEMCACQLTSRIVQGTGSIQLFVQRCFMGLEPEITVQADGITGDTGWRWWHWMRKYRVWEANRKVFLWPENWIEPELKKDRSPFFKDLENELLQNEINQYTVEDAFTRYLEKLEGVAQLEIAGFYQEDDGDNTIIHVFGRTLGAEPHLYYYRRFDYRQWSPWEKVELDIQGDYLIPAVVNRRLFLFWPVFTEVPDEAANSTMTLPSTTDTTFTPQQTRKRLRLQMAVSEYRQGVWTPKRISKDAHESAYYEGDISKKHYVFTPIDNSEVDGRFGVRYEGHSVTSSNASTAWLFGAFEISGCSGVPERSLLSGSFTHTIRPERAATGESPVYQKWKELGKIDEFGVTIEREDEQNDFALENYFDNSEGHAILSPVLMQTPDFFNMSPALHLSYLDKIFSNGLNSYIPYHFGRDLRPTVGTWLPFFYSDNKRTFFVLPSLLNRLPKTLTKQSELTDEEPADQQQQPPRYYYPEIKDFFGEQHDTWQNSVQTFVAGEIGNLDQNQRQAAERFLHQQFSETVHPPYTDEQLHELATRFFMRYVHLFLGGWSLALFQFRQFHFKNFYHPLICSFKKLITNPAQGISALMSRETQLQNTEFSFYQSYYPTLWVVEDIPLRFSLADIKSLPSFASQLLESTTEISQYIRANLSTACRQQLDDFNGPDSNPDLLRALLVEDLSNIIASGSIYNDHRFSDVSLRPKTLLLLDTDPSGDWLIRLNRLLIEDAFPRDISRERDAYPKEEVDFSPDGSYASYNWEIFFHAPLLIANSLSRNQRFEEAREWYHFIFNPLGDASEAPGGTPMSKYWLTKPFFQTTQPEYLAQRIDNILHMLSGNTEIDGMTSITELEQQVLDWKTNPFEPHRIANYRTVAYQKNVIMKYLDNLIAWGDSLFRQDSMESINEATQLYILAAELLGPPPKKITPPGQAPVASFNEIEEDLDAFSNALIQVENLVPSPPETTGEHAATAPLPVLYFCIPHNEKQIDYWETVADRLYKIRHCMNIEGVKRQLALFEPPIDPGALVKAVASGLDIGSAIASLNAPLPLYRFDMLLKIANDVVGDVKALGSALLSALEKNDAESLVLLRQGHEIRLLEAVKEVRSQQIEEAELHLESLLLAKAIIEEKRDYYRDIEQLIPKEELQLEKLGDAHTYQESAQGVKLAASIISILPAIDLGASGFGGTPIAKFKLGGLELGQAADLAAEVLSFLSLMASNDASRASIEASFERRWDEWKHQEALAEKEHEHIDKQIAEAELRVAITKKELANQELQVENAKAADDYMRSKYTNLELYQWQVGQISRIYFQNYQMAFDLAKQAEQCFRFELGVQDSNIIKAGYWDSLKKGLLSGEKLQYDLRRLETAYMEQNRREFELSKHISLRLLDPLALVKLREKGRCFLTLPEELFDLDYPGHYFRRIKSVSLTIPCVTGPYTTISCTLRLLKNSIRVNTTGGTSGYPRNVDDQGVPIDDERFMENISPVKAIASSSGRDDSGVFELSFRDERYLPFEGSGVISQWSLELLHDEVSNNPDSSNPDFGRPLRQFDYDTISDVVLHLKYTARGDTGTLKNGAITNLRNYFQVEEAGNSIRLFNLRQEFPNNWNSFLHPAQPEADNIFMLDLNSSVFPFRDQQKTLSISQIQLLAKCSNDGPFNAELIPFQEEEEPHTSISLPLVPLEEYGGLHYASQSTDDASPLIDILLDLSTSSTWQINMTGPSGRLQEGEVLDIYLIVRYTWETA